MRRIPWLNHFLLLSSLSVSGVLLLAGCAQKAPTNQLAPTTSPRQQAAKPTEEAKPIKLSDLVSPEQLKQLKELESRSKKSKSSQEIRAWFKQLSPQDIKTLDETGAIEFPFEQIQRTNPSLAQVANKFMAEDSRKVIEAAQQHGKENPKDQFQAIKTIGFKKWDDDRYSFTIRYTGGRFVCRGDTDFNK
jgi:hypothetical protein